MGTKTTTSPNVNPWEIESTIRKKLKEGVVLEDGDFVAINIDRHAPMYLRITGNEMFVRYIYGVHVVEVYANIGDGDVKITNVIPYTTCAVYDDV